MYIRTKTTPNSPRKSIQIVEGSRTGGKVKQKILRHVGIAMDDAEEKKLLDLAAEIMAKMLKEKIDNDPQMHLFDTDVKELEIEIKSRRGRKNTKKIEDILPPNQVRLDDIVEKERLVEGVHEVGRVVYKTLGYDSILSKREGRILQDLVLARLAYPRSKHKLRHLLSTQFGKEHGFCKLFCVSGLTNFLMPNFFRHYVSLIRNNS